MPFINEDQSREGKFVSIRVWQSLQFGVTVNFAGALSWLAGVVVSHFAGQAFLLVQNP
ncbi:MAG: hypothetical protein ACJ05G_01290 [Actinomycetota bacterium]